MSSCAHVLATLREAGASQEALPKTCLGREGAGSGVSEVLMVGGGVGCVGEEVNSRDLSRRLESVLYYRRGLRMGSATIGDRSGHYCNNSSGCAATLAQLCASKDSRPLLPTAVGVTHNPNPKRQCFRLCLTSRTI